MLPFSEAIGQTGPDDLMICTNGAEILRLPSGEAVYENRIPPALCREVVEWLDGHGAAWQVYRDGKILTSARNEWSDMDTKLTGQPCELVADRESVIASGQLKFLAPAHPEEVQRTMAGLKAHFGGRLAVFTSKPFFLEILEPRSDKGTALERLADMLGLDREEVMAVGDAHNDLGMISWAGWGCAPANALPEVRSALGSSPPWAMKMTP
jgi:hydroxymethylpyrimidine pyrophosphatase-like HAD family hydrolase